MKISTATLLFVFIYSLSFAGMTCNDSGSVVGGTFDQGTFNTVQMVTCRFDTTPGTASTTIPMSSFLRMHDRWVYSFFIDPLTPGPTNDSDVSIVDSRGVTIISATGNGADVLDNTATNGPIFGDGPGGTNYYPWVHQSFPWTISVINNAVNNSGFLLYMEAGK